MRGEVGSVSGAEATTFGAQSLSKILVNSNVVAVALIRDGLIVFANPAFHDRFRPAGTLVGAPLKDFVAEIDRDRLARALDAANREQTTYFGTGLKNGDMPFDLELNLENALLEGGHTIAAFASDITDRHRFEEKLSYLAYSDPLTGLANRALFADRLREGMLHARLHGSMFAVLMADLDGFKAVNDTYGHDAGDIALQLVAQRLQACIRGDDTLARLGGDEFAVVLPRLNNN